MGSLPKPAQQTRWLHPEHDEQVTVEPGLYCGSDFLLNQGCGKDGLLVS